MTTTLTGPPPAARAVTLYYRDGTSDKVYAAAVEPRGPGYVVTFACGRRGGTLTAGTKTPEPVGLDEAGRIYDRLVRQKTAKGYTPAEGGTPFTGTGQAGRVTCVLPQLLNPV